MSRMLLPAVLAAALGVAALSPAPARAQSGDELIRVLVDVADVMFRNGTPYYRGDYQGDYRRGNFDADDRLIVVRDRDGRPTYYRRVLRHVAYDRGRDHNRDVKCNKHGKCKVTYYDARYDRDRDDRYDDRDRWEARRWRERDDDDHDGWDDDGRWDDD